MRENELDIALYLFNHDCGSDKDKDKVLMQACESGELKVVKELVEQHSITPTGEILCCTIQWILWKMITSDKIVCVTVSLWLAEG